MIRSTSHVPILLFCTFALVGTQSCRSSDDLDPMLADTGKLDAGPQDSVPAKSNPSSAVGTLASGSADPGSAGAESDAGEDDSIGCEAGACVECWSDADCAAPTCHNDTFMPASTCVSNTCVAGEPETCAAPKGMCDPAQGCIACMTDSDCAPASCNGNVHTPAEACQAGTCVESAPTTCPGLCTVNSGCMPCTTNADCAPSSATGFLVCDTSTGSCISPP
ncbi:MAG: hypothetical protein BGO98_25840 [Myxococcales bacterium 68-20]|nr:MAG: hypothetical protein BGO98_25840 [Myxococcales bacterium 68-20]